MLVILGKEAEGHGCHRVVTPGPVQAAEEVTAFLGKEGDTGVRSPAGARMRHQEPQVPNSNPLGWQVPPRHEGTFVEPPWQPGSDVSPSALGDGGQAGFGVALGDAASTAGCWGWRMVADPAQGTPLHCWPSTGGGGEVFLPLLALLGCCQCWWQLLGKPCGRIPGRDS